MAEINRKSHEVNIELRPYKTEYGETWKNELKMIVDQVRENSKKPKTDENPNS